MLLLFSAFVSCMWNGPKGPDSLSFLLPQVSYMHGESSLTACIPCILASASFLNAWEIAPRARFPCILASASFLNAWGMAPKGQIPLHSYFRKFLICMGNGPKQPVSHAFLLPQVSYMHGEWPQRARFPCKKRSFLQIKTVSAQKQASR